MSVTSLFKGILWIASAVLSFFIAAMTVSPQEAAQNIERWLKLLGLSSASNWFTQHAHHRMHLSADSITRTMSAKCSGPHCAPDASPGTSFEVPEVVLFALAALTATLVLIWLMRRKPTLLASRGW